MKTVCGLVLFPLLVLMAGCKPVLQKVLASDYPALELVAALPVKTPFPLEPSGLTWWNGHLYTVADKDDRTIYRIDWESDLVRLVPAIRFAPPGRGAMDWEGLSVDDEGVFHLVSETKSRILRVTADGQAEWASPDLREATDGSGFFAKTNAGFEGLAWLEPGHFVAAVEREPRGIVEWRGTAVKGEAQARVLEYSPFSDALPLLRLPDFSGLDREGESLFALFRNAHLVVRLARVNGQWQEAEAWSYAHIETDPRWAYLSQTYGQAEGLVVEGRDVYLIIDNNLGGRQADPKDGRPLLVHARFPAGD